MPTKCIDAWFKGKVKHCQSKTLDCALRLARMSLRGERILKHGPTIECSPTTLKREYYKKEHTRMPRVPSEVATVLGLKNPDDLFGTTKALPEDSD